MRTDPDDNKNYFIGLLGAGVFFFFTVLVPFLKIAGGFLWRPRKYYYWDVIKARRSSSSYVETVAGAKFDFEIIWQIIPVWGPIWLIFGLLGAVLVSIPPLMKLRKMKPIKTPVGLIGLIIGLAGTIVEYGLFFLLWFLEWFLDDWGKKAPYFNLIILGCFIIGWVALVIGYRYPMKSIVRRVSSSVAPIEAEITLTAEDIHKFFGGVKALEGATVTVTRNKMISLIGPNGCGKTTLFNVITAWLVKNHPFEFEEEIVIVVKEPLRVLLAKLFRRIIEKLKLREEIEKEITTEVGSVTFENTRVDGLSAHEAALTGMMRTFQTTRNWPELTVLENLLVAPHNQTGETFWKIFLKRKKIKNDERTNTLKALEVLEFLEITHIRDQIAQELSGGQLKLLALGRLLMTVPRLFLLDEPMAGINPTLGNIIMDKIVDLTKDATVFLIEHNMDVVFHYSDEIFVMASGKIIAQGAPDAIEKNRDVIEAYLGKDY